MMMQQPKTQAEQQQVEKREDRTAGRVTSHAAQAIVRFAENLRLGKSDARFGVAGSLRSHASAARKGQSLSVRIHFWLPTKRR